MNHDKFIAQMRQKVASARVSEILEKRAVNPFIDSIAMAGGAGALAGGLYGLTQGKDWKERATNAGLDSIIGSGFGALGGAGFQAIDPTDADRIKANITNAASAHLPDSVKRLVTPFNLTGYPLATGAVAGGTSAASRLVRSRLPKDVAEALRTEKPAAQLRGIKDANRMQAQNMLDKTIGNDNGVVQNNIFQPEYVNAIRSANLEPNYIRLDADYDGNPTYARNESLTGFLKNWLFGDNTSADANSRRYSRLARAAGKISGYGTAPVTLGVGAAVLDGAVNHTIGNIAMDRMRAANVPNPVTTWNQYNASN